MICPYCNADHDRVIDSRAADGGASVRRRRECLSCQKRYTTYERVEKTARIMVIKRDGTRVPFDLQSILKGIQAACGKRPISEEMKIQVAQAVEEEVHREHDREVESIEIGRLVAARLREIDPVTYIRYASEYYDFKNVDDFAEELTDLKRRPRVLPNQEGLFGETPPGPR